MMPKYKVVVFDLDDTLYKEIDFLKSAYREISDSLCKEYCVEGLFEKMLHDYEIGKNAFQEVIDSYQLPIKLEALLEMYRNHFPDISLDGDTRYVLNSLKSNGFGLGIITDGRQTTQTNKMMALGLNYYINDNHIVISEVCGHEKTDGFGFAQIENCFPDCDYYYVGDNPQKDFIAANERGWTTICLLDDGRNIHKQNFDFPESYQPKYKIANIKELGSSEFCNV